jgi:HAD superfamily hydrolase (TIGR01509 family)
MVETAAALGHALTPQIHLELIGLPWAQGDERMRAHFGDDFPLADFNSRVKAEISERAACAGIALKAGVREILDTLDSLGLPRGIATSSGHASVKAHLEPGLLSRFHAVVAAGDYARGKPNPDPYLVAAERLGADPADCLALEDSHNGVRAACAAGMMTVMIPDLLEPNDEIRALCIAVARSLHDVREWLSPASARLETSHA